MTTDIVRETHRARYEALRAAGQGSTASALPPLSPRGRGLPAEVVREVERLPGGWYWTTRLRRGEGLRIVNEAGTSAVSLMAWCTADPSERLCVADTIKIQWSAALKRGRVLYTDMGRIALSIIEDSCGAHDTLIGPSTAASVAKVWGTAVARNGRDNFLAAAAKLGLSRRDVHACVTFFAPVRVSDDGRLAWIEGHRQPGDFVDLRAEMDLWVVVSNTAHPLDPLPHAVPAAVQLTRFEAALPGPEDPRRLAGTEAQRAFERTDHHAPIADAGVSS
jgi:hypothetical protein